MSNTSVNPFGRFPNRRRPAGAGAFTLLEVLIVVGVIALLATILLTAISKARESSRRVSCLNNVQNVARAIISYTADNENAFPASASITTANDADWVWWQTNRIDQIGAHGIGKLLGNLDSRSQTGLAALRCPADSRLASGGYLDAVAGSGPPGYPFSYVINGLMCAGAPDFGANRPANLPSNPSARSMTAVKDAANKILVFEEDARTIDDGNGILIPNNEFTNLISLRHEGFDGLDKTDAKDPVKATAASPTQLIVSNPGKSGNVAFCDGHAEAVSRTLAHSKDHWAPDAALFDKFP